MSLPDKNPVSFFVKYSTLFVKNRRAVYIAKIVATSFLHCVSSDDGIAYSSSECAPEPWMPRLQRAGIPMRVTKEVSELELKTERFRDDAAR